jgi:hypothetical protein
MIERVRVSDLRPGGNSPFVANAFFAPAVSWLRLASTPNEPHFGSLAEKWRRTASSGPALGLVLFVAPHKVVERLMAARELGLGSRGPDPKGPWAALDALGCEPRVALELAKQRVWLLRR